MKRLVLVYDYSRKSLVFESEKVKAVTEWKPYCFKPMVTRDGQIYLMDRDFGSPALVLTADAIIEMAKSQRLRRLGTLGSLGLLERLQRSPSLMSQERLSRKGRLINRYAYLCDSPIQRRR